MVEEDKPFFTAEDFRPVKMSDYPTFETPSKEYAAAIANAKVALLVEENARLKNENTLLVRKWPDLVKGGITVGQLSVKKDKNDLSLEMDNLKSLNATYRSTLERIADPTPSMGRPAFTDWELREMARQALAKGEEGK